MKLKKLTLGTNYIIIVLLFAGIIAVINAFSYRYFVRIDLTENKKYTISDSTIKLLSELDDIVNIKVYMSKKLPPYLTVITDQVKDLLAEYMIYSEGNIVIEYIDPSEDPNIEQKLRFMGIPQLRLNIVEKDQAAIVDVYMGLAVFYGDSREIMPALTDIATIEYELTGKILRVTSSDIPTIGFLSGHGEPDLQNELGIINNELREQYYTRTVITANGDKVPDEVAVLAVVSPRELSDRDLFDIDQYIMSGGRVIFLIDTVDVAPGSLQGKPVTSQAGKLLEHYGVRVRDELVLDQLNAEASFQSGPYNVFIPYPFWVRTVMQSIESNHPVTASLESIVFPWASPVEVIGERTKDKTVSVLAQSSKYSWTQKGFFDFSPEVEFMPSEDKMKQHVMAVAVSGKFDSYFADRKIPSIEPQKESSVQGKDNKQLKQEGNRTIIKQSPETKIIVVGNSRFISGEFPLQFDGNRAFFLNAIDWFTIGDYLINIRSRESGERPLKIISDKTKSAVRAVNIFGVPIVLALFGLLQAYVHRRRKRLGGLT